MTADLLQATVVLDYQNVHLTAADLFREHEPRHLSLISPLRYALELVRTRNTNQRAGYPHAALSRVLVYRGLPSAEHNPGAYRRNLAQQAQWQRDGSVSVTLRPLKYIYTWESGSREVDRSREKGIDVLCTLAFVRESHRPDTDVVILASQDTDLEPAVEEAQLLGSARAETASWFDADQPWRSRELRMPGIWNTRLNFRSFQASLDLKEYR